MRSSQLHVHNSRAITFILLAGPIILVIKFGTYTHNNFVEDNPKYNMICISNII